MSIFSPKVTEMAKLTWEGTANDLLYVAWKARACGILQSCFPTEKPNESLLDKTPDMEIWGPE